MMRRRPTHMSHGRRLLLSVGIPPLTIVGYFVTDKLGFVGDFYDDTFGPFLIFSWFGLLFSNMYVYLREDLLAEKASERTIAIMAGGLALVFFIAAGGPAVIWREPWMFGAAVVPGLDIAWPYLRGLAEAHVRKMQSPPDAAAGPSASEMPSTEADLPG